MAGLQESHISRNRKIAGYILSIIPSLIILMSGVMKVIGSEQMKTTMAQIPNFENKTFLIGALELIILALYWIPKTSNIGFFLMASYCGGIIVAEIVLGGTPILGIGIAALFYVGTMLRKPSLSGLGI